MEIITSSSLVLENVKNNLFKMSSEPWDRLTFFIIRIIISSTNFYGSFCIILWLLSFTFAYKKKHSCVKKQKILDSNELHWTFVSHDPYFTNALNLIPFRFIKKHNHTHKHIYIYIYTIYTPCAIIHT